MRNHFQPMWNWKPLRDVNQNGFRYVSVIACIQRRLKMRVPIHTPIYHCIKATGILAIIYFSASVISVTSVIYQQNVLSNKLNVLQHRVKLLLSSQNDTQTLPLVRKFLSLHHVDQYDKHAGLAASLHESSAVHKRMSNTSCPLGITNVNSTSTTAALEQHECLGDTSFHTLWSCPGHWQKPNQDNLCNYNYNFQNSANTLCSLEHLRDSLSLELDCR
jgi:hypothetical protein